MMNGFLGTGATFRADLNLTIQVFMGLALLMGAFLARKKKYKAHQYCQTSVVVLNLILIVSIMLPSFRSQVLAHVPAKLNEHYYLISFIHAALGILAESLGIYIVLVAGTKLIPPAFRFTSYKLWMRTVLCLWWTVILLGIGTYGLWYIVPDTKTLPTSAAPLKSPETISIKVSNFKFEPTQITVPVGTVVEWIGLSGKHTIVSDEDIFKSDEIPVNGHFQHRFDKVGKFPYYCGFHGDKGGEEMAGVVEVVPVDSSNK